jgi:hypothetical protein
LTQTGALSFLAELFDEVWVPEAVLRELEAGRRLGHSIPNLAHHPWLKSVNPSHIPVSPDYSRRWELRDTVS